MDYSSKRFEAVLSLKESQRQFLYLGFSHDSTFPYLT
jgi:hypothetical protein